MKKTIKLLAVLSAVLLLSGCSAKGLSPESTIKAPGATGYYAGVQKALEQAVGKDIVLKYPLVNGRRSAFCSGDFNGSGKDEVLAFYQQKGEAAVTRMNLLSWDNGKWSSVQDIDPAGKELLTADTSDLDLDGNFEILTGWQVSTAKTNQLCIYKMENGGLIQRADETYNAYTVCDIDNDGRDDVGIALIDSEKKQSSLTFNDFENNDFKTVSHIMLDGGVTEYPNVQVSKVDGKNAVYLDGLKSSDTLITEVVYTENGVLYNPFSADESAENTVTARKNGRKCKDLNGDGKIEIPLTVPLPGYDSTLLRTDWSTYENGEFKSVMSAWYCVGEGYYLVFEDSWQDRETVIFDPEKGTADLCEWDKDGKAVGNELFRIETFETEKFDRQAGYISLASSDQTTFAVKFSDYEGPFSVSFERLKNNFRFIVD